MEQKRSGWALAFLLALPVMFVTMYGWFAMQMIASRWSNDTILLAPLALFATTAVYFAIDRTWTKGPLTSTLARTIFIAFASMILLAIEIPSGLTIAQRSREKETLTRMRVIVAALDGYARKRRAYPNADSIAALGMNLPRDDGWSHPFVLHSRPGGYVLISYGLDGKADERPDDGPTTGPEDDIIVRNGEFVRFPEGMPLQ